MPRKYRKVSPPVGIGFFYGVHRGYISGPRHCDFPKASTVSKPLENTWGAYGDQRITREDAQQGDRRRPDGDDH